MAPTCATPSEHTWCGPYASLDMPLRSLPKVQHAAFPQRLLGTGREPVCPERLTVGHPEAIRLAPDGIEEVAVLAHERVALRGCDWPAAPHVDHDLVFGDLQHHGVAEQMETDAAMPDQEAGRRHCTHTARRTAQRRHRHVTAIC